MVRNHEHDWRQDDESPIIEDGAAIFHEVCNHVDIHGTYTDDSRDEVYYDEGEKCHESRSYRFEYSHLVLGDGTRIELPTIGDWDEADEMEAEMVEYIEEAFHNGDADINVCPAREYGEVVISAYQWELHFEP